MQTHLLCDFTKKWCWCIWALYWNSSSYLFNTFFHQKGYFESISSYQTLHNHNLLWNQEYIPNKRRSTLLFVTMTLHRLSTDPYLLHILDSNLQYFKVSSIHGVNNLLIWAINCSPHDALATSLQSNPSAYLIPVSHCQSMHLRFDKLKSSGIY